MNAVASSSPLLSSPEINPAEVLDHPSGYLALSARNQRFTLPGVPGCIAYRAQGKHLILFGGVHAPPTAWDPLLAAFQHEATQQRRGLVGVQVRTAQVDLFRRHGFRVNQFGTTYGLRLRDFSLAGTPRVKLRHKIKQARVAGLRIKEVGRDLHATNDTFAHLQAVSDAWLRAKGKKELDFMIGELGQPTTHERRIFVVTDATEAMVGFITYVPVWGERPGYLHDLTRRVPTAPTGAMELCNATAIERFLAEAVEHLHFGFTPFIIDSAATPRESRFLAWMVRLLGTYGSVIYPAQSQVQYKLKWGPTIIEREWLALQPPSLRAIVDLLVLTRSV